MTDIYNIFSAALDKVLLEYPTHKFILERDLVWTVYKQLIADLNAVSDEYTAFCNFPVARSVKGRSLSADLVILKKGIERKNVLDEGLQVELAAEFKFEPSKERRDICRFKLPVFSWSNILGDIERVEQYVCTNKTAKIGVALFVDEYGRYSNESKYQISSQSQWHKHGTFDTDYLNVHILKTVLQGEFE